MVRTAVFWVILAFVALGGCTTVSSVEPLGERPKEIIPQDWEGRWITPDNWVMIRVADKDKGLLQMAWVEEKLDGFKLESFQVELRQTGDWTFWNLKAEKDPAFYYWGRVKKDNHQITIFTPNSRKFRQLVETGVLPGKVDKEGDISLERLTPEHLKLIMSEERGVCLDWENPLVLFRLGK